MDRASNNVLLCVHPLSVDLGHGEAFGFGALVVAAAVERVHAFQRVFSTVRT